MDFIASGYVLAGFLTLYGIVFLWLSQQEAPNADLGGKKKILNLSRAMYIFGFFYLLLAFGNVFVATGNTLFLTNQAPCENLVHNSTYNYTSNVTTYQYYDSCENREVPKTNERLYVVLGWVMGLNLIAVIAGFFVLIVRWLMRW